MHCSSTGYHGGRLSEHSVYISRWQANWQVSSLSFTYNWVAAMPKEWKHWFVWAELKPITSIRGVPDRRCPLRLCYLAPVSVYGWQQLCVTRMLNIGVTHVLRTSPLISLKPEIWCESWLWWLLLCMRWNIFTTFYLLTVTADYYV